MGAQSEIVKALLAADRRRMTHGQSASAMPREVVARGSILPIGRDQEGNRVPAWPQMALDVGRAVTLPGDFMQGKEPTMDDIGNFALTFTGAGLGAGAGAAGIGMGARPGIKAYHGSPHNFDRFELSPKTIGTGEGAQAYGHGLYFAEREGTARSYRDALASWKAAAKNAIKEVSGIDVDIEDAAELLGGRAAAQADGLGPERAGQLTYWRSRALREVGQEKLAEASALLDKTGKGGSMYEVRLNAAPEDFLDWDRPLHEWTPEMREKMRNAGFDTSYREGSNYRLESPGAETSGRMREAGIPGIRYLDQGSRGAGEGTYNYTVFDDSIIDIIRKYGWAGIVPGAGVMGEVLGSRPNDGRARIQKALMGGT